MVAARVQQRYTPAEYLALERRAEAKGEYVDGCIVAMAGGSKRHNRIALNVVRAVEPQLDDSRCEVFAIELRVRITTTNRYTYPDVTVVCGEQEFEDAEVDTLVNPTIVFEVLSPSTEAYDCGSKFAAYRRIPSLQEYVLIAQDQPSIEHYLRQGDHWQYTAVTDLDGSAELPTIGCTLPLSEVYRLVEFSNPATEAPVDAT